MTPFQAKQVNDYLERAVEQIQTLRTELLCSDYIDDTVLTAEGAQFFLAAISSMDTAQRMMQLAVLNQREHEKSR